VNVILIRLLSLDDPSSVPGGGNDGIFSLCHRVQNVSWAHPSSCPMDTGGSYLGGKAAGTWSWLLTSIECRS